MKKKIIVKLIISVIVIGGALGYLVVNAIQSSWAYDISVDDFLRNETTQTHKARVGGIVQAGSIEKDLELLELKFVLVGQNTTLPVSFHGPVPDNFEENREVLVEGRLDNDVFRADNLITKCESKYKSKVER